MVGYDFKTKPMYPKANSDLRASTSLELHYIHKDDLQQILRAYQKFELYFMENFVPAYNICDEFEVRLHIPLPISCNLGNMKPITICRN